jgi:hypothetical protein
VLGRGIQGTTALGGTVLLDSTAVFGGCAGFVRDEKEQHLTA